MLKEMCQIKGAAKRTSVSYRPQSQGPVERFNRTLIKDLKVKGANQTLKQGTVIRSIRLTDDPHEIDCHHDTIKGLVLRTEFVRKR